MLKNLVFGGVEIVLNISSQFKVYGNPSFGSDQRRWTFMCDEHGKVVARIVESVDIYVSFPAISERSSEEAISPSDDASQYQ
jgi:hypothetical protein